MDGVNQSKDNVQDLYRRGKDFLFWGQEKGLRGGRKTDRGGHAGGQRSAPGSPGRTEAPVSRVRPGARGAGSHGQDRASGWHRGAMTQSRFVLMVRTQGR